VALAPHEPVGGSRPSGRIELIKQSNWWERARNVACRVGETVVALCHHDSEVLQETLDALEQELVSLGTRLGSWERGRARKHRVPPDGRGDLEVVPRLVGLYGLRLAALMDSVERRDRADAAEAVRRLLELHDQSRLMLAKEVL